MKLDEYRRKRDPRRTNEPFPSATEERRARKKSSPAKKEGTHEGVYVVHLHDATRRHHDLRFQVGDVLASFAVPRGPSLDPKDRRLAVRTEEHPFKYIDFEEVIPEGNYGAGPMILWDRGEVRYTSGSAEEGLDKGHLDMEFTGEKLKGAFTLIRTSDRGHEGARTTTGKEQWLLFKRSDVYAAPGTDLVAEAPRSVLSGLTVEELDAQGAAPPEERTRQGRKQAATKASARATKATKATKASARATKAATRETTKTAGKAKTTAKANTSTRGKTKTAGKAASTTKAAAKKPRSTTTGALKATGAVKKLTPSRVLGHPVSISHPDKVLWPGEGITKGDLCAYYEAIAPAILPYLKDRPLMMVRYPDGISGKHFHQWSVPRGAPSWVRTERLPTDDPSDPVDTIVVDDVETLLYVANLGAIELHTLATRVSDLKSCDFFTIDFDVKQSSLQAAIPLVVALGEMLEDVGFKGYPKTSGKSGMHVLVPLGPDVPFEAAKMFADLFGKMLVKHDPKSATMERRIAGRGARVFIDTGQTGSHRTIAAAYSPRAHAGGTVSMPVRWDEVTTDLDPAAFTLLNAPERVAREGELLKTMFTAKPDVAAAVKKLEKKSHGARAG